MQINRVFLIIFIYLNTFSFPEKYSLIAQNKIDSLYQILPKEKTIQRAEILCKIAKQLRVANADSAKVIANEALMISKQFNDALSIAESYNALGGAYLYKGEFYKAIDNFQLALLNFSNINATTRVADMMNNLGIVYRKIGKYDKAIDYYIEALKIHENNENKEETISLLNNIGAIYYYQKNYKKANDYYQRVLEIAQQTQNTEGISAAYSNLSLIALEQKDLDKALLYNKKSLDLKKLYNDSYGIAICLNNMGRIYQALNDFNQAVFYYLQAVERYKKIGDWDGVANSLHNVGNIYFEKRQYQRAIKFLEESSKISDSLSATINLRDNYRILAKCYEIIGNKEKAYKYLAEYVILNDSILTQESLKHVAELEAQYESGRKESEIKLLKQEKLLQEKDNERHKAEINRQLILRNSLLAGLGFIIIIVILIFIQYLQKQKANKILKQQNLEINNQKLLIEQKNNELAEKNKEITDSIRYAQRIQNAILPPDELIKKFLPESFILFKPKDIVSGDFYWFQPSHLNSNLAYIAAVDCTGHGVPGAFMSIIGNNLLNEALKDAQKTKPSDILNELDKNVTLHLHHKNKADNIKDGMDISLCAIDKDKKLLQFAGAYNSLIMIRNNEIHVFNADKKAIGTWTEENKLGFKQHDIPILENDVFYIFSDGYADQFGGPKAKKFKTSQLKEYLLEIHQEPFETQKQLLNQKFESWRGQLEQVDDILVIGFKVI